MVQGQLSFLNPYKHELSFFSVRYKLLISVTNLWTQQALDQSTFNVVFKIYVRDNPYIASAKNWVGVWVVGLEEITALSAQMAQNIGHLAEAPSVLFSVNYTDAKQK